MTEDEQNFSFESFKNSFYYGSRADLNFKFLKDLPSEEAAKFFQNLLWKLGDTLDDGHFERIVEHITDAQAQAYAGPGRFVYEEALFTPLKKPVSQLRLALMASSGHFVEGDDPRPFDVDNMSQQEAESRITDFLRAEPHLSKIPIETPEERLRVRHPGVDVRGAQADPNVNFPIALLREMQAEGKVGELFSTAYSFVGATSQIRLQKHTGPEWVRMFHENQIEAVLMVPV
jgi:D-proline reductase (dithiol) PrdB